MNLASWMVLVAVAVALVLAVRYSWRRRGRCCDSDCARCQRSCNRVERPPK